MEIKKDYTAEFLVVSLILLSGFGTTYFIQESGDRAVCRGGFWEFFEAPNNYKCSINDRVELCHHLSSTFKTCYLGILVDQEVPDQRSCEEYFCYEEKDYCRYKGLIDQPKVPRSEACG